MYSNAQPVIVERHLPLMPMGLISPACCWASIDDDLTYHPPPRAPLPAPQAALPL